MFRRTKLADTITGDWEIFCAAIASDEVKARFIKTVANWANVTPTNYAMTDLYDAISGE